MDAHPDLERKLDGLKRKYREIAELTRPKCMGGCHEPGACCQPRYCSQAAARAREFGISLAGQAHPTLPYLGPDGCVAPPYLRPLCSMHVCEFHLLQNPEFAEVYLALREEVCRLEEAVGPSCPAGLARDFWE
ncbi:MAG: hypothetical protein V3S29_13975 [bacterium]